MQPAPYEVPPGPPQQGQLNGSGLGRSVSDVTHLRSMFKQESLTGGMLRQALPTHAEVEEGAVAGGCGGCDGGGFTPRGAQDPWGHHTHMGPPQAAMGSSIMVPCSDLGSPTGSAALALARCQSDLGPVMMMRGGPPGAGLGRGGLMPLPRPSVGGG